MKHGRRLTFKQKQILIDAGLNYEEWFLVKNLPHELHIKHRETGEKKVIRLTD